MPWVEAANGNAVHYAIIPSGWIAIALDRGNAALLSAAQARELAINLQAAAERLDPQPPPKPRRESGRKKAR